MFYYLVCFIIFENLMDIIGHIWMQIKYLFQIHLIHSSHNDEQNFVILNTINDPIVYNCLIKFCICFIS